MTRKQIIYFAGLAVAAGLVLVLIPPAAEPVTTSGNPGLQSAERPFILQGIDKHELPAETIPADFLWGAGKFGVFEVHAPPNSDLTITDIMANRVGGTDRQMSAIWLRVNRERVYAQSWFWRGDLHITHFPKPDAAPEETEDTELDGELHRLMIDAPRSYTIPAGESAIFEFFGLLDASVITEPFETHFCLDNVKGTLEDGKPAESSLNETCWSTMTILPVS